MDVTIHLVSSAGLLFVGTAEEFGCIHGG